MTERLASLRTVDAPPARRPWCGASDRVLLAEVVNAIKLGAQQPTTGVHILLWGPVGAMETVMRAQVSHLTLPDGPLGGYRQREITVCHNKEDALGQRPTGIGNVTRRAVLLSPRNLRPSLDYAISHIGWAPALVAHAVWIYGLSRECLVIHLLKDWFTPNRSELHQTQRFK